MRTECINAWNVLVSLKNRPDSRIIVVIRRYHVCPETSFANDIFTMGMGKQGLLSPPTAAGANIFLTQVHQAALCMGRQRRIKTKGEWVKWKGIKRRWQDIQQQCWSPSSFWQWYQKEVLPSSMCVTRKKPHKTGGYAIAPATSTTIGSSSIT